MPPSFVSDPSARAGNIRNEELRISEESHAELEVAIQTLFTRKREETNANKDKVSGEVSSNTSPRPFEYILKQTAGFVEVVKEGDLTVVDTGENGKIVLFKGKHGQEHNILELLPREFFKDTPDFDGRSERKEPISLVHNMVEMIIDDNKPEAKVLAEEFRGAIEGEVSTLVEQSVRNSIGNHIGGIAMKEATLGPIGDSDSGEKLKVKPEKIDPADFDNEDDFARALYPREYQEFYDDNVDTNDPLNSIFKPSPLYTGDVRLTPGQQHEFRASQQKKERAPRMKENAARLVETIVSRNNERGLGFIATEMKIAPKDFSEQLRSNSELETRVRAYFTDRLTEMAEKQRSVMHSLGLQKIEFPSKVALKQLLPERVINNSSGNIKQDPYSGSRLRSRDMVVEYAIRMLDGRWDSKSESNDESFGYYRDVKGEEYEIAITGQHRSAAKLLLYQ